MAEVIGSLADDVFGSRKQFFGWLENCLHAKGLGWLANRFWKKMNPVWYYRQTL